jgi:BirA family biotin operon repressor/biotin-[acetyl-CoA-carboxylase] ligase
VDGQAPPHQLPLVAGLAVRNAAAELTGNPAMQLKWPNDVLFDLRKVAGLLCERVHGADLVGLGLNVNVDPAKAPAALRGRVTSLSAVAGKPLDMTTALSVVAAHLHRAVSGRAEEPFPAVLREYDAHHALVGRVVTVTGADSEPPVSGRCEGMDEMGRLVLRSRSKLHRVISGQVTLG